MRSEIRDALGRAHYERMRAGMHSQVAIAPWEELTEATREAYRRKLDYVTPVVYRLVSDALASHVCSSRTLADLS